MNTFLSFPNFGRLTGRETPICSYIYKTNIAWQKLDKLFWVLQCSAWFFAFTFISMYCM